MAKDFRVYLFNKGAYVSSQTFPFQYSLYSFQQTLYIVQIKCVRCNKFVTKSMNFETHRAKQERQAPETVVVYDMQTEPTALFLSQSRLAATLQKRTGSFAAFLMECDAAVMLFSCTSPIVPSALDNANYLPNPMEKTKSTVKCIPWVFNIIQQVLVLRFQCLYTQHLYSE